MIGITDIGVFIPSEKINNFSRMEQFEINEEFIQKKIGIHELAKKNTNETASDLCVKAYQNLLKNHPDMDDEIDCVVVCTQNGDFTIPHTAAIVHDKLELKQQVASFDISLGCSGYIYALHVMKSFMMDNDLKCGLLFTSDPYSDILDKDDKNTALLFGDAATVTLLTEQPKYHLQKGIFESYGQKHKTLIKRAAEPLHMNGREIFNFVLGKIPDLVSRSLTKNNLTPHQIDQFLFHQASLFLIEKLTHRLQVEKSKVPFKCQLYGNTVSSSIPILLKEEIDAFDKGHILMCGFGVGLSMAATVLNKAF